MPFTFEKTELPDLKIVLPRVFPDDRGFFCETYKHTEFAANGIDFHFKQDNHSCSSKGILRGLHYQVAPYAQGKLVRVVMGKIWDVAVDLRMKSPTFGKWIGVELSDENQKMLWLPPGFAHGFVTLSATVHFMYKCTEEYNKPCERGIRWDDPDLVITWPMKDVAVSERDAALPSFKNASVFEEQS
jgi:dTDP-4-dehydrorhamnose 3,5-epimerase